MIGALLVTGLGRLLPVERREWADAMRAELEAVPEGRCRRRFVAGCIRALLVRVVVVRFERWATHPAILGLASAAGLMIGALDQAAGTRTPMWIALLASSAGLAWYRPSGAWRWGLLLAAGMPCLALASEGGGPYQFDRADALYGIPPAMLAAVAVAAVRRRVRRMGMLALVTGLGLAVGAPGVSAQTAVRRELSTTDIGTFADSLLAEYLREASSPSLALVVVKDGAIVFSRGYGTEDAAGRRPVDPDSTKFWLASLTKLVTTDAVLREVDRGRVALDGPAAAHLGQPLPSRRGWRVVTVEDLLTHTAGLDEPFMQGTVEDSTDLVPLDAYLGRLRWRAGTRPGAVLRYSNHGMALAGLIVERTSGMPFAEYVEREVFAPAGMTHSTVRQPLPAEFVRRLATAGTDHGIDYILPAPAGAMVGTATDMGRFLAAQMDTASPRAAALRTMHTTHWRGHPAVPGVALGWFETNLGGIPGLYHTGARHHFSVVWFAPAQRAGLVLVHSMRQGGRFQDLRTEVVRAFAERYFTADAPPEPAPAAPPSEGVYRPALLGTTTVERAGYLFLDTPVRSTATGGILLQAPGTLGTITAQAIGDGLYEVQDGPQASLRLGFVEAAGEAPRIAMGGTLLDPVIFARVAWWQRGRVHLILLIATCLSLGTAALVQAARWLLRRRRGTVPPGGHPAWGVVSAAGGALLLAPLLFAFLVVSTPEINAAAHMRTGLRGVGILLSVAAMLGGMLPLATAIGWRRTPGGVPGRALLCLLSLAGIIAAGLLWHYRLVGVGLW